MENLLSKYFFIMVLKTVKYFNSYESSELIWQREFHEKSKSINY